MSQPVNKRKELTIKVGEYSAGGLATLLLGIATTHVPFLAWGPIDKILRFFLERSFKKLFEKGVVLVNSIIIDVDINADVSRLENALEILSLPSKIPEQIKKDNDEIKNAMRDLITIGRSKL